MVARLVWDQDAAGSNPVTSTKEKDVSQKGKICGTSFLTV